MKRSLGRTPAAGRGERGSARLKFIIVLAVVAVAVYMAVQYVPLALNYSRYKTHMQETVDKAAATGQGAEWARGQLAASAKDYDIPQDAKVATGVAGKQITATVNFKRPVNLLPFWTYDYSFDYTVKSTEFLDIK